MRCIIIAIIQQFQAIKLSKSNQAAAYDRYVHIVTTYGSSQATRSINMSKGQRKFEVLEFIN